MQPASTTFYEITPTLENYWRAVILFGRNTASYKFALARSLFDLHKAPDDLIRLDELAVPFSRHLTTHLKLTDRQGVSTSSKFLDACRAFNTSDGGEAASTRLLDATVSMGFTNVIDAFHRVHDKDVDCRFFLDERRHNGGIRLTENFFKLTEQTAFEDLNLETEARWRLVETAWDLKLARNMILVATDESAQILLTHVNNRRITITSSREALNGYQKGKCFYCYRPIGIVPQDAGLADVDHFFPFALGHCAADKPVNGVANLVLACQECNRGANGKFHKIPQLKFLERLHKRNEYLIGSHHPLRETLIAQTGFRQADRHDFLQTVYNCAKSQLIHDWAPAQCDDATF